MHVSLTTFLREAYFTISVSRLYSRNCRAIHMPSSHNMIIDRFSSIHRGNFILSVAPSGFISNNNCQLSTMSIMSCHLLSMLFASSAINLTLKNLWSLKMMILSKIIKVILFFLLILEFIQTPTTGLFDFDHVYLNICSMILSRLQQVSRTF